MPTPVTLPAEAAATYSLSKDTTFLIGKRHSNNTWADVSATMSASAISVGGTTLGLTAGPRTQIIPNKSVLTDGAGGWVKVTSGDISVSATTATIQASEYAIAGNTVLTWRAMLPFTTSEVITMTAPTREARTTEFRNWAGESVQLDDGVTFNAGDVAIRLSPNDYRAQQLMTWYLGGGALRTVEVFLNDSDGGGLTGRAILSSVGKTREQGQPVLFRIGFTVTSINDYYTDPANTGRYYTG